MSMRCSDWRGPKSWRDGPRSPPDFRGCVFIPVRETPRPEAERTCTDASRPKRGSSDFQRRDPGFLPDRVIVEPVLNRALSARALGRLEFHDRRLSAQAVCRAALVGHIMSPRIPTRRAPGRRPADATPTPTDQLATMLKPRPMRKFLRRSYDQD